MPSPTTSVHTAIKRLAPLVPRVIIMKDSKVRGYLVGTNPDPHDLGLKLKPPMDTLAMLADLMPAGAKEQVHWVGQIPSKGLAAWEVAALTTLGGVERP